jgi:polyhydroxyalkanoate synthesis regulator phasin
MGIFDELLKQGLYTGVGLLLKTNDAIMDLGNKIIETTKMSQEEGRQFVEELLRRSKEAQKDLNHLVDEKVKENLAGLNVASQDDLTRLKGHITKIELLLKEKDIISDSPSTL